LSFFQLIVGKGSPKKITLSSRGLELSRTSSWGRRPTVIQGGDFEFSFSKMERDRDKFGFGYLAFEAVLFSPVGGVLLAVVVVIELFIL